MPVNYLNIYVFAIFGGLAATVGGIFICYSGMSETSYLVYRGMELTTYYLDKNTSYSCRKTPENSKDINI